MYICENTTPFVIWGEMLHVNSIVWDIRVDINLFPNELGINLFVTFTNLKQTLRENDTFSVLHQMAIEEFTNHINSLHPHIKFTIEEEQDGQLPFLDTCIIVNEDGSLKTKIYHKLTHTDQYLNLDSTHPLEHKRSVVRMISSTDTLPSLQLPS